MKVHEYQAKALFAEVGIPVPRGILATTAAEASAAFTELGGPIAAVKAQIHAGGRGKGGGIKLAKSAEEAAEAAQKMFENPLVTHQTGPEGQPVRKVWVEAGCDIADELYVGLVLDRAVGYPVVMVSTEGGVDIEEVAASTPEKIHKAHIRSETGLYPYQARELFFKLGLDKSLLRGFVSLVQNLSRLYLARDCSLAEINPLVITKDSQWIALDGKLNFDDSALYRQRAVAELRDTAEEDPAELRAADHNLSYIALDGSIGCMVNGAGLAMSTMDIIKHEGGEPANFLDVGGSATAERVAEAFRIITGDPEVKAILVNIFGGIVKCDVIADGITAAARELELKVPLVVRLEGTNVDKGNQILDESGLDLVAVKGLASAAQKVVELAGGAA